MKYLRRFETIEIPPYNELVYKYVMAFDSEEQFREWCLDKNDQDEDEDVDWDNVVGYDLPLEVFDLPTYDTETGKIIGDILTEVDLDDPKWNDLRSGEITFDEWKEVNKYNL